MMPKGVEHPKPVRTDALRQSVRLSVMPKGVEHWAAIPSMIERARVRLSVMPKGVEHRNQVRGEPSPRHGATISDAERR